jgi:ribosomal protein L11 methylase PrmA
MRLDIPFVPSSDTRLKAMLELAEIKAGERAIDLGSGDGKLVIALARQGAIVDGYELDEGRVNLSKENITKERLTNPPQIYNETFWNADLSQYDLIVLYGITSIMERLEKKLTLEAKPGTKVVSNLFKFPKLIQS